MSGGRSRWKTENENHNVLKTRGYHLEHNFGHGKKHWASFLFHTVLQLMDKRYQEVRRQRFTHKGLFQDLLCLTKYLLFESWQHLLDFMLDHSAPSLSLPTANTS